MPSLGAVTLLNIDSTFSGTPMPFDYYCLGYCIAYSNCQWKLVLRRTTEEHVKLLCLGGSGLHVSKQNTSIISIDFAFEVPGSHNYGLPALTCLFDTLHLHIRVDLKEVICELDFPGLIRRLGMLLPSLKILLWRVGSHLLSVEDLRELCHLLASTPNNLQIINIGHYDYQDGDSDDEPEDYLDDDMYPEDPPYVNVGGTYQHTSVSVDIRISSVDDVTSTVSVLSENSHLGLHITAIKIAGNLFQK